MENGVFGRGIKTSVNFFQRQTRVFSQFSPAEQIPLFVQLCGVRLFGTRSPYRHLVETKRFFDTLISSGFSTRRVSAGLNRVNFDSSSDTGRCDILLRRKSTDLSVFTQVFINQEYRPVVDFIDKHWSRDRVLEIVDAGGYTGMTAIYFRQFFQKARLVILEPNRRNFELLKKNIEVNHLEKVSPVCAGLWNTDTKLTKAEKFRDGREWSFSVRAAGDTDEEVFDGISFDSLMKRYAMDSVDILKMDVEGAERKIFQDEEQVSRLLSRVRCLAIEIHGEYDNRGRLQEILRKNSFELIKSGELTIGYNTRRSG